ncbi:septum site-determining protein Ssd [Aeromicrobium sp. CF3.5]|uniref:septum site-determining protein Ssd n=1 Tax=Aeromicrobium sp. CF3.5 TaxID=3373078 RepID=UPI003EE490AC
MPDIAVIATADPLLLDSALRWCAAVGAAPVALDTPDAVRREWRRASAVLVGADLVPAVARSAPPRRDHVLVVADHPDLVWRDAVAIGAASVVSPGDDDAALAALVGALDGRVEGCTVSVVGGSGGVGASTFAVALGLAGAGRGLAAVVLDADPTGSGVDLVLGSERATGLRWPDLAAVDGRLAGESLSDVLPRRHGVATIAWPGDGAPVQEPAAAGAVWSAATRAFDLVVADVPRPSSAVSDFAAEGWVGSVLSGSLLTVVLIGDDLVGLGAARRIVPRVTERCGSVLAVVVSRRGGLGTASVEQAVGIPVIARIRPDRRLRAAVDHGRGPGRSRPLRRASVQVLDTLGLHRSASS